MKRQSKLMSWRQGQSAETQAWYKRAGRRQERRAEAKETTKRKEDTG